MLWCRPLPVMFKETLQSKVTVSPQMTIPAPSDNYNCVMGYAGHAKFTKLGFPYLILCFTDLLTVIQIHRCSGTHTLFL